MRLWAAAKSKALCIDWCMDMFFKVVHNDINQCLEQIKILRTPNLVPTDPFEVETKVNVALRAKLISEVKVNICKLKVTNQFRFLKENYDSNALTFFFLQLTSSECIDVLAAICKMLSLAKLRLCFPKTQFWQTNVEQETANEYIGRFLSESFQPGSISKSDFLSLFSFRWSLFAGGSSYWCSRDSQSGIEDHVRGMAWSYLLAKNEVQVKPTFLS